MNHTPVPPQNSGQAGEVVTVGRIEETGIAARHEDRSPRQLLEQWKREIGGPDLRGVIHDHVETARDEKTLIRLGISGDTVPAGAAHVELAALAPVPAGKRPLRVKARRNSDAVAASDQPLR